MIASNRKCLDRDELQQVLAGRISPAELDTALLHLDDCDQCRSAAESMENDGQWVIPSLADESPDPLHAETDCQVALLRMLQSPPGNSGKVRRLSSNVPCDQLGPYKLIETLGTGGMGTVYLAKHERLKRKCAIKLLPRDRVDQPGWLDRFDREMTTVAALEHPNVVRATDAGHQDGWHFLVMEYLDGLDVGRVAHRMPPLGVADACEIIRQAALGLQHIHQAGLVHRDIKPSNLMLTRAGIVKLLDLGLVLDGDDPLSIDDRLTTVGHLMGTMSYMAPEQLADSRDVTAAADIYSLGATLFRLLSGHPPHRRRGTLAAHIMTIANEDPASLDSIREDVDGDVVALVNEMLARDPAERPSTAADVAARLSKAPSDSRLKGVLRDALRRPGKETSSSVFAAAASHGDSPPKSGNWRWVAAAMFPLAVLLAAIVFRVQTDKGEFVVHSEQDGLTVLVKQADEVVDRLLVESGENRTTLRKGSYRIQIEGGGEALKLSDEVVTIGRRKEAIVKVKAAFANEIAERTVSVFQNKTLDQWMHVMAREQDVRALGEAMNAVDVLSRGTKFRTQAAKACIERSRKWGGYASGNFSMGGGMGGSHKLVESSPYFMERFLEVMPNYFPEPAIELIGKELKEGTEHSKAACVYALTNYFSGVVSDTEVAGKQTAAQHWCTETWEQPGGRALLSSLSKSLADFAVKSDDENDIQFIRGSQLQLIDLTGRSVVHDPDLVAYVKQRVAMGIGQSESKYGEGESWMPPANFRAAVAIAADNPEDAEWDYLAKQLFVAYHYYPGHIKQLKVIADAKPDLVCKAIEERLLACDLSESAIEELQARSRMVANGMFGGGGFGGGTYNPVTELLSPIWAPAIKHYAEHSDEYSKIPLRKRINLLIDASKALRVADTQVDDKEPNPIFASIDQAVSQLESRLANP